MAVAITILTNVLFLVGNKPLISAGEFIYGFGSTFFSGPLESLAFRFCDREKISYDSFISRIFSLEWMGLCLLFLFSYIFSNFICVPACFYAIIAANVVGFFCALTLPDLRADTAKSKGSGAILKNFLTDLKGSRHLMAVFALNIAFSVLLVSGYQLLQTYLLDTNENQAFNGIIYFVAALFASLASFLYDAVQRKIRSKRAMLLICMVLITICFVGLFAARSIALIFVLICLYRMVWGLTSPIYSSLVNSSITRDDYCNTAISFLSLASNLFESAVLGALANVAVRTSYLLLGVLRFVLLLICIFAGKLFR